MLRTPPPPVAVAAPWPAAEAAFRRDDRWLGGDDAYSIPLGPGRHLWLFGDTFVGDGRTRARAGSTFINNSIAIQTGDDPRSATMRFHWRTGSDGRPASFFVDPDPDVYLWPQHGALVGGRLLLFFMRVRHRDPTIDTDPRLPANLQNFEVIGWAAQTVDGVDGPPGRWRCSSALVPATPQVRLVGAGVVVHEGHLYAHALTRVPRRDQVRLLVVRWDLRDVAASDLRRAAWFAGDHRDWSPEPVPSAVSELPPLTEFTVHHDPVTGRFCALQLTGGRSDPRLELRVAEHPWGPWSPPRVLHRPPIGHDPDAFAYAGKAHPGIGDGTGYLVTYASNGTTLAGVLRRDDLYYPHALRLSPGRPDHNLL